MKKLDTSNETATLWSVDKVESWAFAQDSHIETINSLALRILGGTYATNKVYILFGCVGTGADPGARTITAGAVFYNGEVYLVDATSFTSAGSNVAVATISDTADPVADPTLFSDNTTKNIHRVRKVVIAAAASGSGIANFSNFIPAGKYQFYHASGTQTTTSGTYVDLTGSTFTTPNDGITRNYLIMCKTRINFSGSTGDGGVMKLYAGSDLDITENYRKANVGGTDVTFSSVAAGMSCQYFGAIAPNTTIKVQIKSSNGLGSIDFTNNSFVVLEQ